ncbi:hypothetical protein Y1Q_0009204 [Alligator mississippiensis]|uniref:Uncharacterized protein n=1 Tax=Alligator mississippiensis TaxID=8496 RepID=A0A151M2Q1_ALLMI|nr:hypothetical protein Y1Q_0009204 [Alligator mississippiensis]
MAAASGELLQAATAVSGGRGDKCQPVVGDHPQMLLAALVVASSDWGLPIDAVDTVKKIRIRDRSSASE